MKCRKTNGAYRCAGWQGCGSFMRGVVQDFAHMRMRLQDRVRVNMAHAHARLANERGQGTTEYAILVGVLVVIAIMAITLFKPKIEELWNAIASGINGL